MLDWFFLVKKFLGRHGSGNFSSLLHGSGIDIAENRAYIAGDEKRSINRKMSAKYDKLFVNLFHDEKAIDVHLCCDVNYNWKGQNTESFLRFFAELTQYFQARKAHITGRICKRSFLQLEKLGFQKRFLDAFLEKTKNIFPIYSSSLHDLLTTQIALPKRRLIIIVSDFLTYGDAEKRLLNVLRQKHDVKLVQMPVEGKRVQLTEALSLSAFEK